MYICDFCKQEIEVLHVHDITISKFRKRGKEDHQESRSRLRVGTCEKCSLFETEGETMRSPAWTDHLKGKEG